MTQNQKIPLAEATAEQLLNFGTRFLGLPFDVHTTVKAMRAQIQQAGHDTVLAIEPAPAAPTRDMTDKARIMTPEAADIRGTEKVRIRIFSQKEDGGDQPIPVGVNGSVMLLPRDQDIEIPRPFYEVLKNAVEEKYDPVKDANGNMVGVAAKPRLVPSYQFQVLA